MLPSSTSLLSCISDGDVSPFSLLRACGFDRFGLSVEGLAEQWWVPLCPQECLGDCAAADAQRLQLGTSPSQKKFCDHCSSGISGIVADHSTHLTPGFTLKVLAPVPVNVAIL